METRRLGRSGIEVGADWIELDWAYQADRGNPELLHPPGNGRRPRLLER